MGLNNGNLLSALKNKASGCQGEASGLLYITPFLFIM